MSDILVDSYSESNYTFDNTADGDPADDQTMLGQSFTGNGTNITRAIFYISKIGSPTGNMVARLYAHTGTFGAQGSIPTGSPIATSDPVDSTTVGTSPALFTFTFSGANRTFMINGTHYFIVVDCSTVGNSSNYMLVGADGTSPTHGGCLVFFLPSIGWTSTFIVGGTPRDIDQVFYVYGQVPSSSGILLFE